ncbi:MAG TPA: hypothetical protein VFU72_08865 [Nitrolancea sp.]|nr:hypothetical protein [Nitrolancea sp.]
MSSDSGDHAMTELEHLARRTRLTRLERPLEELMTQTRRDLARALLVAREHASHPYIAQLEQENAALAAEVAQLRAELAGEHRDRRDLTKMVTQMLDIVRAVATARRLYSQRPGGTGEDIHLIPHSLVVRATELLTIPPGDRDTGTDTQ